MAMSGRPAPLMVPDAELLAKNMRAEALLRRQINAGGWIQTEERHAGKKIPLVGVGSDDTSGDIQISRKKEERTVQKFGRAKDEEQGPGIVERVKLWLGIGEGESWGKAVWPILEKGASVVSKLPEPAMLFLAIIWGLMVIRILRKGALESWMVALTVVGTMSGVIVMSFLWGKTDLFASLREGQYQVKAYPEERLDGLEADLDQREAKLNVAEAELKKNRKRLDLLKKELDMDPIKDDKHRVVKPSKKAVEIISEGALGSGYDAEGAEAAELRKKQEAVMKSREEWKMRSPEMEDTGVKNKIREHTATIYKQRTKQLKTSASAQRGAGTLTVTGGLRLPFTNKDKTDHQEPSQPHPILDVPSSKSLLRHTQLQDGTQQEGAEDPGAGEDQQRKLRRHKTSLKKILSFAPRRSSLPGNRQRHAHQTSLPATAA